MLKELLREMSSVASPERAKVSMLFFKTGPGQYGYGDKFIGITVPVLRSIAKRHTKLSYNDLQKLLNSEIHEHRLVALMILVLRFRRASYDERTRIVTFYLDNKARVNNWDLVDGSAPYILGEYVRGKSTAILDELASSSSLWDRRIAIVSTWAFIRNGEVQDTLRICERLLNDTHDLMHKACGWMLREMGKKDEQVLRKFLDLHAPVMPRTMLRYAIERLSPGDRKAYLLKK